VLPFAITSATQFAPNAPPAMTSAQYVENLNEVKEIGAVNSVTRTDDQTQVARLWANVNTPTNFLLVWNNVARTFGSSRTNDSRESTFICSDKHLASRRLADDVRQQISIRSVEAGDGDPAR
jgi:hypothetical protein